ncbi:MAG: hypothetical protein LUD17_08500 [Bacteroidales bacterium]|nr:hypothetical protein [Bacteroidales bacterium]
MKKFALFLASGLVGLGAMAASNLDLVKTISTEPTPVAYPVKGNAYLSYSNYSKSGDETYVYKILDQDLNEVYSGSITNLDSFFIRDCDGNVYDQEYIYFTQALFNDDEYFEYVVTDDNGFQIRSTNGSKLASVNGESLRCIWRMQGNVYALTETSSYSSNFYRYVSGDSGSQLVKVREVACDTSSDRIVERGASLDIALEGRMEVSLAVYALNGTLVRQLSVTDDTVSLPTADLPCGTYLYSIKSASGPIASGRLIVK